MAQPSVASFFNARKRAVVDDTANNKNRRLLPQDNKVQNCTEVKQANLTQQDGFAIKSSTNGTRTRSGRTFNRIVSHSTSKSGKITNGESLNLVTENIGKQEHISRPKSPIITVVLTSDMQKMNEETPSTRNNCSLEKNVCTEHKKNDIEKILRTPTKQIIKGSGSSPLKNLEIKKLVRKELNFDEVKTKITRSQKIQELKASLARIQELERARKAQEQRNKRLREGQLPIISKPLVQLKEFVTIELEVLTSPSKTLKTPNKIIPRTPDKNELMSPRHTEISKRLQFSPAKHGSPSKIIVPPAYQRFMTLSTTSKVGQLLLPFKYRHLIEIFKGLDSVCAMFYNRKECITFKKLKPAVQRMLRKNFTEAHLAQIKYLFPEAFIFTQMKMRNYGSASKADYFQLIITPNVENLPDNQKMNPIDEDNVLATAQSNAMNPQVITDRLQHFQDILLQRVLDEHDKFLKSLDPPLILPKEKVTRWHPDFNLENCPTVELGHLPQPPNVEKYSSAKDILSTARNLFNCATPMERALERYEAKINMEDEKNMHGKEETISVVQAENVENVKKNTITSTINCTPGSTLLKGVPKCLLEKIRAKEAAKALDAMTRRPSQDQEATKYSRLPDLARHLRNVFITERKGVLSLEIVINKIQNSYRTSLSTQEIEAHLRLLCKEVPSWAAFHDVRKTMYLKVAKDMDLNKILKKLEAVANEKTK